MTRQDSKNEHTVILGEDALLPRPHVDPTPPLRIHILRDRDMIVPLKRQIALVRSLIHIQRRRMAQFRLRQPDRLRRSRRQDRRGGIVIAAAVIVYRHIPECLAQSWPASRRGRDDCFGAGLGCAGGACAGPSAEGRFGREGGEDYVVGVVVYDAALSEEF